MSQYNHITVFPFSKLTANGVSVESNGNFIRFEGSGGQVTIKLFPTGELIELYGGQAIRGKEFSKLLLRGVGGTPSGRLIIGYADGWESDRLFGQLAVSERGDSPACLGLVNMAEMTLTATANVNPSNQQWNILSIQNVSPTSELSESRFIVQNIEFAPQPAAWQLAIRRVATADTSSGTAQGFCSTRDFGVSSLLVHRQLNSVQGAGGVGVLPAIVVPTYRRTVAANERLILDFKDRAFVLSASRMMSIYIADATLTGAAPGVQVNMQGIFDFPAI